ncbi:alcohol dehydrogenase [Chloropicon primus]|uniref:Alcohol dehydrogenase n=1 Tax=Chloropicon primus TaxID=1764295 RepID=A0A5B8MQ21_9CHLO|nr:alcohol dehydrogenase [Chloropicon primus]|eukprot:QDZ21480.1 alcohol dehydrogenase [Chloropicon primus]
MNGTRKAWVLRAGSVKNLQLKSLRQVERPGHGEVLINVRCIGLNFADVFSVLGLYSATPKGEFVPGLEFSGVVAAVGTKPSPDVETTVEFACADARERAEREASSFKPGDRVSGVVRFGAYSTSILAPAHQLRHIPKSWSFEQGAAFNVQALTSFYGLKELGNVKPGQVVLVHSCAGGCGLLALAILKALGAKAIGTVGSSSKVDVVLDRFPGYMSKEQVIVRSSSPAEYQDQLRTSLRFLGAASFDIALDAVAGKYFQPTFDCLGPGGRHVVYGAADMTPQGDKVWTLLNPMVGLKLAYKYLTRPKVDPLELPAQNKSVMGFNLIWLFSKVGQLAALLDQLYEMNLKPPLVGNTFDFEELPGALRLFQSGQTSGKVVIQVKEN